MTTVYYPIEEQLLDAFDFLVEQGRSEEALEMVRPLIGENPEKKSVREIVMEADPDTTAFEKDEENMAIMFEWVQMPGFIQLVPVFKETGRCPFTESEGKP